MSRRIPELQMSQTQRSILWCLYVQGCYDKGREGGGIDISYITRKGISRWTSVEWNPARTAAIKELQEFGWVRIFKNRLKEYYALTDAAYAHMKSDSESIKKYVVGTDVIQMEIPF